MPRSYLPVPEPYVLWRDNNHRYHVARSLLTSDMIGQWWSIGTKPPQFDPRDWYKEVEPGRTFRDRTKALTWLYTKIGKETTNA